MDDGRGQRLVELGVLGERSWATRLLVKCLVELGVLVERLLELGLLGQRLLGSASWANASWSDSFDGE